VARAQDRPTRKGSARRGGPATYSGANYQTLIAVYETAHLLVSLGAHPEEDTVIAAEPRRFGTDGQIGFDIGIPHLNRNIEVKRAPTRSDVRDFVSSIADDSESTATSGSYDFVHSENSRAVADLTEICRIAQEASTDSDFADLISRISTAQHELVDLLGTNAWSTARVLRVIHRNIEDTRVQTKWIIDHAYGESLSEAVLDHVARGYSTAAESRQSLRIRDIADELARILGAVPLGVPVDLSLLSETSLDTLTVLSAIDDPIPLRTLEVVTGASAGEILDELGAFITQTQLGAESALILSSPVRSLRDRRWEGTFSRALSDLLRLAHDKSQRDLALTQTGNIAILAERLWQSNPVLVSSVFPVAEKLFKTKGNLQLALTTARLSLRASQKVSPTESSITDEQLRNRAQTLICGESWVLQRIGELDEAERIALESQTLGEHLGWARNTSFCLKCRGRLSRIRAESSDPLRRTQLLYESETLLRSAIDAFSEADEFGPTHPEVGDCHSLLARTLLTSGQYQDAWTEIGIAQDLLYRERAQKNWADALILEAQMRARESDEFGALELIDEVLEEFPVSVDVDATEITARAIALRAEIYSRRSPVQAGHEFDRASELYEQLEDFLRADQQKWRRLEVVKGIPSELMPYLEGETVSCRVAAVEILSRENEDSRARSVSQRRGLTASRARQIVTEARLASDRRAMRWR
jgi:tetratricopeptide (TPR) repeat protein